MARVTMAYGRDGLSIDIPPPADVTLIRKKPVSVPGQPARVITDALDHPIGCNELASIAHGAKSACILICDITRPVPNGLFLRPLIDRLTSAGIALDQITILVATGLHRPNLGDELDELVGDPWVLDNVTVVNHDARSDADHIDLGRTAIRGTPVGIDRRFVEADVRIATGLVEPHFMAGYSGGRKVVAPGIAHHTTIRTFHSARFMEDPAARSCNLDSNPLHEEQLEIISMLGGRILALNTVLDEHRNLIFASFGEIIASHQAAVDFAAATTAVPVSRRFKTIVTSAAGYPLDKTYYQTVKGMVTPIDILEPGGTLIVISQCSEGIGSPEFRRAQERLVALGPDAFLDSLLQKDLADIDEWQTEMQLKPMRLGRIALFSTGLPEGDHAITGVDRIIDPMQAIRDSIARHDDPEVAVIPEGPYVVPIYAAAA